MEGISICITAYNAQNFIEECLNSVMIQTWVKNNDNWEIIIGVDACEKSLVKICQIQGKYKNLRVLMMDSNQGTYITSNTIIEQAKYNHILRFDSDDRMRPQMLERLWENRNNGDIITFGFQNFGKNNRRQLRADGVIMMKKYIFDTFGGYQAWRCGADSEQSKRLSNFIREYNLKEILFDRRVHEESLTQKPGDLQIGKGSLRLKYAEYIRNLNVKRKEDAVIKRVTNTYKEYTVDNPFTLQSKKLKVLLCCIAKLENNYIEEWVKHYLSLGVDKIIIYDNNDISGSHTEKIIDVPYIAKEVSLGRVVIITIPDNNKIQCPVYTACYKTYGEDYDWLMFFDVDEFLQLEHASNIQEFLSQEKFSDYDMIHINWKLYDDNDLIKVTDGDFSLQKRFTRELAIHNPSKNDLNKEIKSIIRGRLHDIKFTTTPHTMTAREIKCCDVLGVRTDSTRQEVTTPILTEAWLNHYITKTIEEYMEIKLKRGGGTTQKGRYNDKFFFIYNDRTEEKEKYIAERAKEELPAPVTPKYKLIPNKDVNKIRLFKRYNTGNQMY